LQQRLLAAAVLVPVVVIVFLVGQPWLTLGIALLAALAALETARLVRGAGLPADGWLAVGAAPLAVVGLPLLVGTDLDRGWMLVAAAVGLVVLLAGVVALRHRQPVTGFQAWAGTLLSVLYPGLLAFLAGILALGVAYPVPALPLDLDAGRAWLLVLVLTVWTLDSGAYAAGKYHGRGRFMNHISPNKTWSGAIGGTIAAVVVCAVLVAALGYNPIYGALLGLLLAVAAQAGDLVESMLKRAAGVKDSGAIIPGHGGILDRVDSFLFAAPAMFIALAVFDLLIVSRWT
jgi:phosphatidate cytidylyltransferase